MTRKEVTKTEVEWTVEPMPVGTARVIDLSASEVVALLAAVYERIRASEIRASGREIRSRRLVG